MNAIDAGFSCGNDVAHNFAAVIADGDITVIKFDVWLDLDGSKPYRIALRPGVIETILMLCCH